jgi:HEAT repeats
MSLQLNHLPTGATFAKAAMDKALPAARGIAINTLVASAMPGTVELMRSLLVDAGELTKYRCLAAMGLWRANTPEAAQLLLKALPDLDEPAVGIAVVKALGRIGAADALSTLRSLARGAEGMLGRQAAFAEALIAHRLGLEGGDLPAVKERVELPVRRQRLATLAAPAEDVRRFIASTDREPFGIGLAKTATQIHCVRGTWMLGLNRDIDGPEGLRGLMRRKVLLGLVAMRRDENGQYTTTHLVFSSPCAGGAGAEIQVRRISGEICWAGQLANPSYEGAGFTLYTAGRLGVVPLELEGVLLASGELEIRSATAGLTILERGNPRALVMTPP